MASSSNEKSADHVITLFNTGFKEYYQRLKNSSSGTDGVDQNKIEKEFQYFLTRNFDNARDNLIRYFKDVAHDLLNLHLLLLAQHDMVANMQIKKLGTDCDDFLFMILLEYVVPLHVKWYANLGFSTDFMTSITSDILVKFYQGSMSSLKSFADKDELYCYILYANDFPCGILSARVKDFRFQKIHKKVACVEILRKIGMYDSIPIPGVAGQCLMDRFICDMLKERCDMVLIQPINHTVQRIYMKWGFASRYNLDAEKISGKGREVYPMNNISMENALVLVAYIQGLDLNEMKVADFLYGNSLLRNKYLTLQDLSMYKSCKHHNMLTASQGKKCAFCVRICNMLADSII